MDSNSCGCSSCAGAHDGNIEELNTVNYLGPKWRPNFVEIALLLHIHYLLYIYLKARGLERNPVSKYSKHERALARNRDWDY